MEVRMIRFKKPRGGLPVGMLRPKGMGFVNVGAGGEIDDGSFTDLSPWLDLWGGGTSPSDDLHTLPPGAFGPVFDPNASGPAGTPAPMSAADLAEQEAARKELAKIGTASTTAAELAAGLVSGIMRIATADEKKACPSGYVYGNGDCVMTAPGGGAAGQWIPGISNQSILIAGGGLLAVVVVVSIAGGGGGGRRR